MRVAVCAFGMCCFLSFVGASWAAPSDAREVARMNNCVPKKIEVYEQKISGAPQTTYRVECILPKTVGEQSADAMGALLVRCDGTLCLPLRPVK